MKYSILALSLILALANPCSAEDGKVKSGLKKVGHYIKKVAVFPLYIGGGAIAGAALGAGAWYYVGGAEGDLKRAFSGGN